MKNQNKHFSINYLLPLGKDQNQVHPSPLLNMPSIMKAQILQDLQGQKIKSKIINQIES